jgi:uncharacterized heparinase superfamily protein
VKDAVGVIQLKSMRTALRYFHTLRHLKGRQFYRRLWFTLRRPQVSLGAAPAVRDRERQWVEPIAQPSSMLDPHRFMFLNREYSLRDQNGWNDGALDKLWLYNLHYFNDLNSHDAPMRVAWHKALLIEWMAGNPPAIGVGWEPYPTSLRIVNWIKWLLAGHAAPAGLVASLATQVQWLIQRLEWHLLGNHLFANAKALVVAGLFFDSAQSRQWLAQGLNIIERELPEQVLPDGGNFERSPMYHAIFLEDLLDLINASVAWPQLVGADVTAMWRQTAERMLVWLEGMTHPDGQIALFNDAAFGIAPDLGALRAYSKRLGLDMPKQRTDEPLALISLPDSGYVRLASKDAVAILDVAPIGPDYLPGHAHADTLSFELSVHAQRVVVNGGTSRYGLGPERLRERGTAAHSTVEVAGQDSSEVWSGFRVARRAYPFGLQISQGSNELRVSCSHDGYRRLPKKPIHHRSWKMKSDSLAVTDTVLPDAHRSVARYILHPDVQLSTQGPNVWWLTLLNGTTVRVEVLNGAARIDSAQYAPEFGKVLPTHCLAVELVAGKAETLWTWI